MLFVGIRSICMVLGYDSRDSLISDEEKSPIKPAFCDMVFGFATR